MEANVKKEIKLVFSPNSPRTIPWKSGMTARHAIEAAGFEVKESTDKIKVTYTIRVNNQFDIGLDQLVPEPNGSTVTFLMVTEEIKGN